MKSLKFVLVMSCVFAVSASVACGQQRAERRGKIIQRWINKQKGTTRTEADVNGVTSQLDVPYVDDHDPSHKLDLYFPVERNTPVAVLVHFHGGGWKMGDKKMMKTTGLFYASQGILFIAPNYRLSPKFRHPAHVEDCAAALAWVFSHAAELGGDPNRIFVSGHSAGAHLAVLLSTNPEYLKHFNIQASQLAGVISVDTASFNLLSDENEEMVKRFVKQAFGSDEQILKEASPWFNVTDKTDYPKFLILNTTRREAAVQGAKAFADKLRSVGADVRFVPVDDHTHSGMAKGMFDPADPVEKAVMQFIRSETDG